METRGTRIGLGVWVALVIAFRSTEESFCTEPALNVHSWIRTRPRSRSRLAFNCHGFRIAVHRITAGINILQSVQTTDAGVLINPNQLRGQLEGAISQGLGWALYETMVFDEHGAVVSPSFRNYRIPASADVPRSEIYFADTFDASDRWAPKA